MSILLLSRDLLFPSRVRGAAEQQELELVTVSPAQLVERLTTSGVELVLVDLTCPGISPGEITEAVGRLDPQPRLVGFGPHVQEQLLESARNAGFDQGINLGSKGYTLIAFNCVQGFDTKLITTQINLSTITCQDGNRIHSS